MEALKKIQKYASIMTSSLALALTLLFAPPDALAVTTDEQTQTQPQIISGSTRYWTSMEGGDMDVIRRANEKLLDHAVGTINNMFYDRTGGNDFDQQEFYQTWKAVKKSAYSTSSTTSTSMDVHPQQQFTFDTREGAIDAMRYLVGSLHDPYSKYLTREELRGEISSTSANEFGFLGTGMFVEVANSNSNSNNNNKSLNTSPLSSSSSSSSTLLSRTRADNLPRVTAVSPHSPAERGGVLVGDRIAAISDVNLIGFSREDVSEALRHFTSSSSGGGEQEPREYFGSTPVLTLASPVFSRDEEDVNFNVDVIGYRLSKLRLPTASSQSSSNAYGYDTVNDVNMNNDNVLRLSTSGGDSICNWQLLTPSNSIFHDSSSSSSSSSSTSIVKEDKVGYIRLTRFSRISTTKFVDALQQLEKLGAQSYIIDVRNNYGGVIQEAMLTASSLLRELHAPLCYTLNSRGGFTPHDVEEYVVDTRYPGYLLSNEGSDVVLQDLKKSNPKFWNGDGWDPPSNYASLHEQEVKRGLKLTKSAASNFNNEVVVNKQKDIVLIMNEGTASAAEVFVSSLHDNGRTVALVGSKTFGKGLIQHTFPMPDGGGLRLTVAEYLTPSLQHVSKVGGAQYSKSGKYVGGGIQPELYCESKGIPNNPGADLCVSLALDALDDNANAYAAGYDLSGSTSGSSLLLGDGDGNGSVTVKRKGPRKTISAGVVRDDF